MRTITCNHCGYEIAEDDFIIQQCPICDSYMEVNRLNLKVDSELGTIIRVNPVHTSTLVE